MKDQTKKEQILGLVRHVLTIAGGAMAAHGLGSETLIQETIGVALAVVGVAWSWVEKAQR